MAIYTFLYCENNQISRYEIDAYSISEAEREFKIQKPYVEWWEIELPPEEYLKALFLGSNSIKRSR